MLLLEKTTIDHIKYIYVNKSLNFNTIVGLIITPTLNGRQYILYNYKGTKYY